MHEHNRLASIQLLEDRLIGGISQPSVLITRQEPDPICLENVKRVLDLAQAAVRVRERYHCKEAQAARVPLDEIGRVLVYPARALRRRLRVAEPDTWRGKGENSRRHRLLVHRGDRLLRTPAQPRRMNPSATGSGDALPLLRDVERRNEVMMHVNQAALRDKRCLWRRETTGAGSQNAESSSRGAGNKAAPVDQGKPGPVVGRTVIARSGFRGIAEHGVPLLLGAPTYSTAPGSGKVARPEFHTEQATARALGMSRTGRGRPEAGNRATEMAALNRTSLSVGWHVATDYIAHSGA